MNTAPLMIMVGFLSVLLVGCSGSSTPSTQTPATGSQEMNTGSTPMNTGVTSSQSDTAPSEDISTGSERPGSPEPQAADPSLADMELFMSMFNGSFTKVKEAVTLYASTPDLASNDITIYDLANPKVVASNGACHTMEAEAGLTTRVYDICRQDSKISSIAFKESR